VKLGIVVRNMGPQSEPGLLLECARTAEAAGLDDLFVTDHLAIPPDDAEGSNGRYLDPLATLAYLAGATDRIGLGTGILNLPYRPPLPTAKWVATIQELSGGRLLLGVGIGWMKPEFRALGVDRSKRGRLSDETLRFLHDCFASDEVEANGQPFLFRPRPPRPPIFVGGAPPHALERAALYGDGWMPMGGEPEDLAREIESLNELATAAGRNRGLECVCMTGLPLDDPGAARERLAAFEAAGVTRIVVGTGRYPDAAAFAKTAEAVAALR